MVIEGTFDDDAVIRRVHREQVMALAGPRALLMQAAHPVAFAGFFAHTGALDEPYERLNRTARIVELVVFGPCEEAERATRRDRAGLRLGSRTRLGAARAHGVRETRARAAAAGAPALRRSRAPQSGARSRSGVSVRTAP